MHGQGLRVSLNREEKKQLAAIARHHGVSVTGLLRTFIKGHYDALPDVAKKDTSRGFTETGS